MQRARSSTADCSSLLSKDLPFVHQQDHCAANAWCKTTVLQALEAALPGLPAKLLNQTETPALPSRKAPAAAPNSASPTRLPADG